MSKIYRIELDGKIIGESLLEKADAPMGVVTGKINFFEIQSVYDFFKNYAVKNNIPINLDDSECGAIATQVISGLKVYNDEGKEIKGEGNYIEGMELENEGFEITILGYPYPDFEVEFPHHVKEYF